MIVSSQPQAPRRGPARRAPAGLCICGGTWVAHQGPREAEPMKILHPTDFSTCAENARGLAVQLARALGAELILLHVAVETPPFGPMRLRDLEQLFEEQRQWATADAGGTCRRVSRAGRPDARARGLRCASRQDRRDRQAGGRSIHRDGHLRSRRRRAVPSRQRGRPCRPDGAVRGRHGTRKVGTNIGSRYGTNA